MNDTTNVVETTELSNWPKGVKVFVEVANMEGKHYFASFCKHEDREQGNFTQGVFELDPLIEFTKDWAKSGLTDICDHQGNHLQKDMMFSEIDKNALNILNDYAQLIIAEYLETGASFKLSDK